MALLQAFEGKLVVYKRPGEMLRQWSDNRVSIIFAEVNDEAAGTIGCLLEPETL